MIHDEDLKSSQDYNEGQKAAAHRVLVELVNLFNEYRDDIRIVGGWVPHIKLKDSGYLTMSKILLRNGYEEHPDKYFSFIKRVQVDGIDYDVDVDILAGMYGGTQKKKRSQHVQGVKALKATGGDFAFEFDPQMIRVEAERTDGALDVARVNVIAVVPYFVMKTAAMGRGKAKDAYDLYFLVKHYHDGMDGLAKLFEDYRESRIILEMKEKLSEKFASPNHAGPADVAAFLDLVDEEEVALTKRDAYEQIQALIHRLE